MTENTKIEWCDHSASPWHGCQHAELPDGSEHPGCLNCYAETMAKRNPGTLGVWGEGGTRIKSKSFAKNCRLWNKLAGERGVVESVFPSICDPFEDWDGPILDNDGNEWFVCDNCLYRDTFPATTAAANPDGQPCFCDDPQRGCWMRPVTMNNLRRELFEVIDDCPNLRFYLLTKRPGNVRRMWPWRNNAKTPAEIVAYHQATAGMWDGIDEDDCQYRPNVWLLTSVSDQPTADALIPELLACRDLVPVLGVSAEPLLGPIEFCKCGHGNCPAAMHLGDCPMKHNPSGHGIDWIITGGESGHGARPCDVEWIRDIGRQCQAAGVAWFNKQLGSHWAAEVNRHRVSKTAKGGDWDIWPDDLRVRDFPK